MHSAHCGEAPLCKVSIRYSLIIHREIHPALWQDNEVKAVHYILSDKPWRQRPLQPDSGDLKAWWWDSYAQLIEKMAQDGHGRAVKHVEGLVNTHP